MSRAEESSQVTDENSSQEPRMTSESPDRNQLTHRSKVDEGSRSRSYGNQTLRHPLTREPARRRHYSQEGSWLEHVCHSEVQDIPYFFAHKIFFLPTKQPQIFGIILDGRNHLIAE